MTYEVVEIGPAEHRLWAETVAMFRGVQHDRHDRFVSDPATIAIVARDREKIAGWAWGYRLLRADGDSMLLLYEIEVVESERRKGVGRALLDAFLDIGRREGHGKMWLLTDVANEEARALYEAAGGGRSKMVHDLYSWQFG